MSDARKPARENIDPKPGNNRSGADREEFRPVVEHLIIQNLNDSEIARITGIDRKAVAHLRKSSARQAEKHPVTGTVVAGPESDRLTGEILRLKAEGLTYVEIAEEVGLSWTSVRARLRNAYRDYMLEQRDAVAGRQVADIEVMRNDLLEVIIRENATTDLNDVMDDLAEGDYASALKKVHDAAIKTQDAKFRAMELMIRLMDREAKLYGLDADKTMNVNHNIKVEPQAIELLNRLEKTQLDNTIEGEIVEEDWDMGNL